MLKRYLENEGIDANTPKKVLKECYQAGIFKEEQILIKMLMDRNETTHLYSKEISRGIFNRIKNDYIKIFKDALDFIEKELKK